MSSLVSIALCSWLNWQLGTSWHWYGLAGKNLLRLTSEIQFFGYILREPEVTPDKRRIGRWTAGKKRTPVASLPLTLWTRLVFGSTVVQDGETSNDYHTAVALAREQQQTVAAT